MKSYVSITQLKMFLELKKNNINYILQIFLKSQSLTYINQMYFQNYKIIL